MNRNTGFGLTTFALLVGITAPTPADAATPEDDSLTAAMDDISQTEIAELNAIVNMMQEKPTSGNSAPVEVYYVH